MKQARKFYIKLYLFWISWVTLRTLSFALVLSFFSTLIIYFYKGTPPLNQETFLALKYIFYLSFPIFFSLGFIIMLLLVYKTLFSRIVGGKRIDLYDCEDKRIEKPLLSDVTMIWRKWLFITVWTILIFLVLFLGIWKLISGSFPPLSWFNGLSLYFLVSFLGGGVFILGIEKCKKIRITDV